MENYEWDSLPEDSFLPERKSRSTINFSVTGKFGIIINANISCFTWSITILNKYLENKHKNAIAKHQTVADGLGKIRMKA